jgi:Domain of unknown function (DUF4440)
MIRAIIVLVCCALRPLAAAAGADPRDAAVLDTERRWLAAITNHDAAAASRILAPGFVHVTYRGALVNREDAIKTIRRRVPYVQHVSDETVDYAGGAAIVHGINTVTQAGRVILRLRFTDVFEYTNGTWLAVCAQETAIQ